jgi:alpha-ketoglutaric semialdehyde dehydrogenase
VFSAFATGGQRCTSAGNVIVDAPIYDAFVERFLARWPRCASATPTGARRAVRPVHQPRFFEGWLAHYDLGAADGATKLYGEGRITADNLPAGWAGTDPEAAYYGWPTVWADVRPA